MNNIILYFLKGSDPGFLAKNSLRNSSAEPDRSWPGCTQPALDYFDQFFLTLIRLRTGMTEDVLGAVFCISRSTVDRYYNCWIRVMDEMFGAALRKWPYVNQPHLVPSPKIRHLFSRLDLIVDRIEIRIKTLKNPDAARKMLQSLQKKLHSKSAHRCRERWRRGFYLTYLSGSNFRHLHSKSVWFIRQTQTWQRWFGW